MHMLPTYLGNVVGRGHVKLVTAKLEAIINYLVLSNKKEIMNFLGMSDYYRKFYKNFSSVCKPFTLLLSKHKEFACNLECQCTFNTIKGSLVSSPVLMMPDFKKPFIYACCGSQQWCKHCTSSRRSGRDGTSYQLLFLFDKHQRNYSTYEKKPFH